MTLFLGDTTHAYESERSSLCYRLLSVCPVSDGETDSQLNMACMLRRQRLPSLRAAGRTLTQPPQR